MRIKQLLIGIILMAVTTAVVPANMDDIVADMGLTEYPLYNAPNVGWAKGAYIGMGSAPRGDATPTWWLPTNTSFKTSAAWGAMVPWIVIYPGVNHLATNVRVKVYDMVVYVLDNTDSTWKKIDTGDGNPTWGSHYNYDLVTWKGSADKRIEPDGHPSFKFPTGSFPFHGGFNRVDLSPFINPANVGAVYITTKTQLILDNPLGVDDRNLAKVLINIAGDYYPNMTVGVPDFTPMGYVPAIGGSRFGLVTPTVRDRYFATIDPPGSTNTDTVYITNGGHVAIPTADFIATAPPFIIKDTFIAAPTDLKINLYLTKKILRMQGRHKLAPTEGAELSWLAPTDTTGIVGYHVYKDGVKIASTKFPKFTDAIMPTKGTLHSYYVDAYDIAGNTSYPSNTVYVVY